VMNEPVPVQLARECLFAPEQLAPVEVLRPPVNRFREGLNADDAAADESSSNGGSLPGRRWGSATWASVQR
jgi:hypothetical protein